MLGGCSGGQGHSAVACGLQVPTGRHAYVMSTAAHLVGLLLNSLLLGIVVAKGEPHCPNPPPPTGSTFMQQHAGL